MSNGFCATLYSSEIISVNLRCFMYGKAFTVAARSKAWVCGHSLAKIAGSNPAGGMNVSLVSVVWCQGRGLCVGPITVQSSPTECSMSD